MAMALHAPADDLAVEDVEGGKERRGAVAFVVMGHGAGSAGVRSSAWIWLFSSIDSTTAWAGGSTYSPTMSSTLVAKLGSVESLKVRTWWGRRPCVRQIRWTELTLSPLAAAIAGAVQWVTPPGGDSCSVRLTTPSTTALGTGGMRDGRVL